MIFSIILVFCVFPYNSFDNNIEITKNLKIIIENILLDYIDTDLFIQKLANNNIAYKNKDEYINLIKSFIENLQEINFKNNKLTIEEILKKIINDFDNYVIDNSPKQKINEEIVNIVMIFLRFIIIFNNNKNIFFSTKNIIAQNPEVDTENFIISLCIYIIVMILL